MRIAVTILSLGLMLVVGFQSCAATVGGSLGKEESTSAAGAMGFFVVFLFLIAGAFAMSFPIVSSSNLGFCSADSGRNELFRTQREAAQERRTAAAGKIENRGSQRC